MSLQEAIAYIRELQGVVDQVCLTGGEVFLHFEDVLTLVAEATSRGHSVSAMTSAFWAKSPSVTRNMLVRLREAGLQQLGISLDRFHLKFATEEKVITAARMAVELGIPAAIRVTAPRHDKYVTRLKQSLKGTQVELQSCRVAHVGRAATNLKKTSFDSYRLGSLSQCGTVRYADVLPDGKVTGCCGPGMYMLDQNPLVLGNARQESLSEILRRSWQNKFMMMLYLHGPAGLFQLLQKAKCRTSFPKLYTDACALCLSITNNPDLVALLQHELSKEETSAKLAAEMLLRAVTEITKQKENPASGGIPPLS